MKQKVIRVGNSLGITLPQEFIKETGLTAGQTVTTSIEADTGTIKVQTVKQVPDKLLQSTLSPDFVARVDNFIKRHRPALEKLAKL